MAIINHHIPTPSILIIPLRIKSFSTSSLPHHQTQWFSAQIKLNEASHFLSSPSHTKSKCENVYTICTLEGDFRVNDDKNSTARKKGTKSHLNKIPIFIQITTNRTFHLELKKINSKMRILTMWLEGFLLLTFRCRWVFGNGDENIKGWTIFWFL